MSTKDAFLMCLDLYNSKALWKTFSLQTPLSFNAKQHDNYHKIWKHHVFIKPHFVSKLLVGYSLHNQKAYCCCNVKLCTFKKLGFSPISSNWILGDMKHYIYPLKLCFSSLATKISPFFDLPSFVSCVAMVTRTTRTTWIAHKDDSPFACTITYP